MPRLKADSNSSNDTKALQTLKSSRKRLMRIGHEYLGQVTLFFLAD